MSKKRSQISSTSDPRVELAAKAAFISGLPGYPWEHLPEWKQSNYRGYARAALRVADAYAEAEQENDE